MIDQNVFIIDGFKRWLFALAFYGNAISVNSSAVFCFSFFCLRGVSYLRPQLLEAWSPLIKPGSPPPHFPVPGLHLLLPRQAWSETGVRVPGAIGVRVPKPLSSAWFRYFSLKAKMGQMLTEAQQKKLSLGTSWKERLCPASSPRATTGKGSDAPKLRQCSLSPSSSDCFLLQAAPAPWIFSFSSYAGTLPLVGSGHIMK